MKQRDGSYTTKDELFIEADPDEIYHMLLDFNNRHLWWKTNRAKLLDGGGVREGAWVAITGRQWVFPIHFLMRIQKLEKPRLIRLQAERGPIRGICEWQIEPQGEGGALVRLVWEGVRPSGLPAKVLFAMVGDHRHSEQAALGLAGLKDYFFSHRFQKKP